MLSISISFIYFCLEIKVSQQKQKEPWIFT